MEEIFKVLFDINTGRFTVEMNADFIEKFYYKPEDINNHLDFSLFEAFKNNLAVALEKGDKHSDLLKHSNTSVKKFKFKKDFRGTITRLYAGDELPIEIHDGVEYVMYDVYCIFEVDSEMAKKYGEVI